MTTKQRIYALWNAFWGNSVDRRSIYIQLNHLTNRVDKLERDLMSKANELSAAVSALSAAVDAVATSVANEAANNTPDSAVQSAIDTLTQVTAKLQAAVTPTA